eukprot:scaffold5229_cov19-Tisochrysis_lutea.AAC.1
MGTHEEPKKKIFTTPDAKVIRDYSVKHRIKALHSATGRTVRGAEVEVGQLCENKAAKDEILGLSIMAAWIRQAQQKLNIMESCSNAQSIVLCIMAMYLGNRHTKMIAEWTANISRPEPNTELELEKMMASSQALQALIGSNVATSQTKAVHGRATCLICVYLPKRPAEHHVQKCFKDKFKRKGDKRGENLALIKLSELGEISSSGTKLSVMSKNTFH